MSNINTLEKACFIGIYYYIRVSICSA